ncbi:MAG TPA: nucleoside kinase [Bacteroidales bacterium]|nr:nucleoside kinase [Bacteroidales bacterium]HPL05896.1 nucleoside kinase [Bacteroidales bacterium]
MSKAVRIFCVNNNKNMLMPMGVSLLEVYQQLSQELNMEPIAARVNNKTESLSYELYNPKRIEFIEMNSASGMRVYVRTLTFLISSAIYELYPEGSFSIEHSVSNGYYCELDLKRECTRKDLDAIKKRVLELIEAGNPIDSVKEETSIVIELFRKRGRKDIVDLLSTFGSLYTTYCKMGEHIDYYYGALAYSSGINKNFDLIPYLDNYLLRIPSRSNPSELAPLVPQPKMQDVFREFVRWNKIMDLRYVGDLNLMCRQGRATELIKVAEALQEKKIAQLADTIAKGLDKIRIVLISGPSSSGKTTFSKRLSVQLLAMGIRPIAISMDDYFLEREQTPKDEKGEFDYESLYALDLDLFNRDLGNILEGQEVEIPSFNFALGTKEYKGNKVRLTPQNILILEGIHALNPELLKDVPPEAQFKLYISALTAISLDKHNRIPTTDNRLIRRIIRDSRYRGTSARETIARWDSVRAGEEKWIFPFQENADAMFNSALIFEFSVLKNYIEPVLREVPQNCVEYSEARRLLRFLDYFVPITDWEIPPTSLLREFVGGSSFRY